MRYCEKMWHRPTHRPQTTIQCSVQNMWFACLITEARIQTHTFIIFELLCLFKWLIPSDMIKCFTATQKLRNWATTICHYALFSQTVRLKKAISKRIFFCFIAASKILYEDLRRFYCCYWHKYTIKAWLCSTQYLYIVDTDMQLNDTHSTHCCICTTTLVRRTRQCYYISTFPILLECAVWNSFKRSINTTCT
jgi:hypothetical protein